MSKQTIVIAKAIIILPYMFLAFIKIWAKRDPLMGIVPTMVISYIIHLGKIPEPTLMASRTTKNYSIWHLLQEMLWSQEISNHDYLAVVHYSSQQSEDISQL